MPDGLDLDAWIVPWQEETAPVADLGEDAEGKKVKKGKKKDRDAGKMKRKGKAKAILDGNGDYEEDGARSASPTPVAETAEERAERERVSDLIPVRVACMLKTGLVPLPRLLRLRRGRRSG